ncbi:hypothetical protein IV102_11460 [bacterium]|nr:hypothetical protein [bacterium]
MITALAPRSQVVTEIAPSNDPWQASWYSWHESEAPDREAQQRQQQRQHSEPDLSQGCSNFRTLLSAEALGDVWESLLGQTSSQEYVIESWTKLLHLN